MNEGISHKKCPAGNLKKLSETRQKYKVQVEQKEKLTSKEEGRSVRQGSKTSHPELQFDSVFSKELLRSLRKKEMEMTEVTLPVSRERLVQGTGGSWHFTMGPYFLVETGVYEQRCIQIITLRNTCQMFVLHWKRWRRVH